MFNSATLKAVMSDLWEFVKNGFNTSSTTARLENNITFKSGEVYSAVRDETIRARLLLTGEYDQISIQRPLQPSEYVSYLLSERSIDVPAAAKKWATGTWHDELRGQSGVYISIVPTTGAVMEYRDENDRAVTALVHEITDDETIRFGSVGMYEPGVYEELVVPRSVWYEFRPVFINFKGHG